MAMPNIAIGLNSHPIYIRIGHCYYCYERLLNIACEILLTASFRLVE